MRGVSSMATRGVLAELGAAYTRSTGHTISVVSIGGVEAARRVRAGEAFDFVVLAADTIDELANAGFVVPDSRVDLARSEIAVAVAAGAARPDVGSERSVREAVLRASSIGYSTGPSGSHLLHLFERWGIGAVVARRTVQAPPGVGVGALIARGDVELGFQQLSELMNLRGVEVVGRLPREIQRATVFAAAACRACPDPASVGHLLAWLGSSEADDAKRRHGMEPMHGKALP
jgi:molybdate transport system substrate-binding protein